MPETIKYPIWATGRRKSSTARVRVVPGTGRLTVNKKSLDDYFQGHLRARGEAASPLQKARSQNSHDYFISVEGGGVTGQAGAIKLGISRAIGVIDPSIKPTLRKEGFLTRDPRMVERKKPGQPKARRRFQHSKR